MSSRRTLAYAALAGAAAIPMFLAAPFASLAVAHAQTASRPQFLITWKATNSYIPSFYQGKALPSLGSKIAASVELVSASGRLINLANQPIYWYEDETAVGGGVGVQQVTFVPFGTPPSTLDLTVNLPSYPGGAMEGKVEIPYTNPVAVIDAPYPGGQFSTNPVSVTALPFYFPATSADNLSYSWAVNNQQGTSAENPEVANVTLPAGTQSGTKIDVSLVIKGSTALMAAGADRTLIYQSQL